MNRETVIAIIDHVPTVVIYTAGGIAFVVAMFTGNEEASTALGTFLAGAGIIQGKSALASTLKKGGDA